VTERWIVDAMNVIGTRPDGWWKDRRGAIVRLVDQLERWAQTHAPRAAANSADDEIVRLVRAAREPQDLTVVTSDGALVERVRSAGAAVHPAAGFRQLVDPE